MARSLYARSGLAATALFALGAGMLATAGSSNAVVAQPDYGTVRTLTVGAVPASQILEGLALNTAPGQAWVGDRSTGDIYRIDEQTGAILNTVHVGGNPIDLVENYTTGKVYTVNQQYDDAVAVVTAASNSVTASIFDGGFASSGIAVDEASNTAFVASCRAVATIDGSTDASPVTDQTPIAPPDCTTGSFGIAFDSANGLVYGAAQNGDQVVAYDTTAHTIVRIPTGTGSRPQQIAVNPVTNRIYATSGNGKVYVIDGATNTLIDTITGPSGAQFGGVTVDTVHNRVWASDGPQSLGVEIDGLTDTVTNTYPTGYYPWTVKYDAAADEVYFVNAGAATITVLGHAPVITSGAPAAGAVGTAYSHTVTATGAGPITFSVASGTLPAGLSLNPATGVISGTPTAVGTSTFTVTATNSVGTTDAQYSIVIGATAASGSTAVTTGAAASGASTTIPTAVDAGGPGSPSHGAPGLELLGALIAAAGLGGLALRRTRRQPAAR